MNRKKKVLIIEDNIDIQEVYKIYFESAWFEVYSATDWLKWVSDSVEKKPDVILLDIMMPQMNGFEVLQTIKEQSSISVPIIVCSNLSQQSDIDKAYKMWAELYITKSQYEWEEIVDKVLDLLKTKGLM